MAQRRNIPTRKIATGKGKQRPRLVINVGQHVADSGLEASDSAPSVRIEIKGLSIHNLDEAYIERFKSILKNIYSKAQDASPTANSAAETQPEQPEALHRSIKDYNLIWNKIISERE